MVCCGGRGCAFNGHAAEGEEGEAQQAVAGVVFFGGVVLLGESFHGWPWREWAISLLSRICARAYWWG